jgi:putative RNA 2'-phosphotransferase
MELDLDLPTENIPDELFYPVTEDEASIVLEVGLKPTDRRMVHLSRTAEDARVAGSVRTPTPTILAIDARRARQDGHVIRRAGKTVFLTERVPPEYLRRHEAAPAPTADVSASVESN